MDAGASGRFDGDPFFSRDANVGLSGRLGSFRLGRATAPNFLPTILTNPFGDSFTFSPLVLHANVNTAAWSYSTTPSDTGWDNQIRYSTPNFRWPDGDAAVPVRRAAQHDRQRQQEERRREPDLFEWSVVAYYERDQVSNPGNSAPLTAVVVGATVPETKKDWMIGDSYNPGFAKFFVTYGGAKTEVVDYDAKTTSLGVSVSVPVGAGAIMAAIASTKVEGTDDGSRTTGSVGYDYFRSKRTDLYAVLMQDRITDRSHGNSFGAGMRHRC